MTRSCEVLRVFTRAEVGGNHLGVITDIEHLTDAEMQRIAAELGFSETVFIDLAVDPPHTRIFTPTSEMPFAGHPLVGATWALYTLGSGSPDRLTCQVGEVAISFDGQIATIATSLDQGVTPIEIDAPALGLPDVVSSFEVLMPLRYTVVELATADAVARYEPIESVLAASSDGEHMLVYARDLNAVRARFFAPASGILEDPATGSAAVALAATRLYRGELEGSVSISQGEEVGFPSTIFLSWSPDGAEIGGTVVHDETRTLEG